MKGNSINTIIILQAPNDLQYVLGYLKAPKKEVSKCKVIVIGFKEIHDFLVEKGVSSILIPRLYFKKPSILFKLFLLNIQLVKIKTDENTRTIFFSDLHDLTTSIILKRLKGEKRICRIYKYEIKQRCISFKERMILKLVSLTFNIQLDYVSVNGTRFYRLRHDFKELEMHKPFNERIRIKFNSEKNLDSKKILFIEGNGIQENYFLNYKNNLEKIISKLKVSDYEIYFKGHPRVGLSNFISASNQCTISDKLPIELYQLEDFEIIFGIESTAIGNVSKIHPYVYSLIKIFDLHSEAQSSFIKTLRKISENNLKFIENYEELNKLIRRKNEIEN